MGSSRFSIDNMLLIDAGDLSGDVTSGNVETVNIDTIGAVLVTTGTHAGNLFIQGSNDGVSWENISAAVAVANTGVYPISEVDWPYSKARLFYDSTSGTGSGTIRLTAKGR